MTEAKQKAEAAKEERRNDLNVDLKTMEDMSETIRKTAEAKEKIVLTEFKQNLVAATNPPTDDGVKQLEQKVTTAKGELPTI